MYTIFKLDLSTNETTTIKKVETEGEAKQRCASFTRLIKTISTKASEDWVYFYRVSEG